MARPPLPAHSDTSIPAHDPALRDMCPAVTDQHPQTGNRFSRWLGHRLLGLFGWRLRGQMPPVSQAILIGVPHTSNWDLPLALGMRMALGLDYSWMMKAEAFRWPFGALWKSFGGIPIRRKSAKNATAQVVDWFEATPRAFIGITPEGTRSKVDRWKTGYLRIAEAANVPVMIVGVDGRRRELVFDRLWPLTGDQEADNEAIRNYVRAHYTGIVAKRG